MKQGGKHTFNLASIAGSTRLDFMSLDSPPPNLGSEVIFS
jgi:hypothetical protein